MTWCVYFERLRLHIIIIIYTAQGCRHLFAYLRRFKYSFVSTVNLNQIYPVILRAYIRLTDGRPADRLSRGRPHNQRDSDDIMGDTRQRVIIK